MKLWIREIEMRLLRQWKHEGKTLEGKERMEIAIIS